MSDTPKKIALVTGASRGIGAEIALQLARDGIMVFGTATTDAGADKITKRFEEQGLSGQGKVLNVTDTEGVKSLVQAIKDDVGSINVLVNNAGIARDNLLLRMTDDEWDDVIATNLTAVFRLCKICLKDMFRARWGRIVNLSSVVGVTGNSGQANYAAAKAGIIGFSKSLAKEVASRGVTANVVAPGFIETDMTKALPEIAQEGLLKVIPMKRIGNTQDIAAAVSYLVSEQARYVTGQTLHINGGMLMV